MGNKNININIKDILKIEKELFFNICYRIILKNGSIYLASIEDFHLLRLENYLRMPYSKMVSDQTKLRISQDNKNGVPIVLSDITIVFKEPTSQTYSNIKHTYIRDIIAYHKLLVHRGAFESIITKVLENKEEIYTQEFQNRFNTERDKFLELLKKKTETFTSKL